MTWHIHLDVHLDTPAVMEQVCVMVRSRSFTAPFTRIAKFTNLLGYIPGGTDYKYFGNAENCAAGQSNPISAISGMMSINKI